MSRYGSCPICGREKGYRASEHRCSGKAIVRIDRENQVASDSEDEPDPEPDEAERLNEGLAILERVGD